ncbi:hypothetical protein [Rivibacter subsaxonicus]|uniref:ABC-2 type transport system permease protein n=1 Tax=Rivibacter subsaxonicus TaxID=457575 RepID=A0A4Q7VMW9_9BURK|nr:hypothetical protein [Rivibacter subsaxonicus]RZT97681.1 hypothetical protein EV670_2074 [Rivibacter subsaxonicus]
MNSSTRALPLVPWRQMLLAPWWQTVNQGSRWTLWITLAFLAAVPVILVLLIPPLRWWQAPPLLGVLLLAAAWWMLASSLLQQNHPNAARLVPGHLRRLRLLFLLSWAVVALVAGLLLGALLGHVAPCIIATAAVALFFAWAVAWPLHAWLAWGAWFLVVPITPLRAAVPTVAALLALPPLQLLMLGAAVAAVGWCSAHCLLGHGESWHLKRYAASQRIHSLQQWGAAEVQVLPKTRFWSAINRGFNWGYHLWLARLLARLDSSSRARLAMVFGPSLHWSTLAGNLLMLGMLLPGLLMLLVPLPQGELDQAAREGASGMTGGALLGWTGYFVGLRSTLYTTRREQALLVLAPGLPRRAELNRWLVRHLALHHLASGALIIGVAAIAMAWLFGGRVPGIAWAIIGAFVALALPAGLVIIVSDWSRLRRPGPLAGMGLMLPAIVLWVGIVLLVARLDVPAELFVGVGLVLLVLALAWARSRMERLPQMLPAARRAPRAR